MGRGFRGQSQGGQRRQEASIRAAVFRGTKYVDALSWKSGFGTWAVESSACAGGSRAEGGGRRRAREAALAPKQRRRHAQSKTGDVSEGKLHDRLGQGRARGRRGRGAAAATGRKRRRWVWLRERGEAHRTCNRLLESPLLLGWARATLGSLRVSARRYGHKVDSCSHSSMLHYQRGRGGG